MKAEDVKSLPAALAGDFKSIEPHLRDLDKHLTLRTYVEGYTLGETEANIWKALKMNKAAVGFIKKGSLVNLTRWFVIRFAPSQARVRPGLTDCQVQLRRGFPP